MAHNNLNKQNKYHFGFFKNKDDLNLQDSNITWVGVFFDEKEVLLNRRVSKISPRKSRRIVKTRDPYETVLSKMNDILDKYENN